MVKHGGVVCSPESCSHQYHRTSAHCAWWWCPTVGWWIGLPSAADAQTRWFMQDKPVPLHREEGGGLWQYTKKCTFYCFSCMQLLFQRSFWDLIGSAMMIDFPSGRKREPLEDRFKIAKDVLKRSVCPLGCSTPRKSTISMMSTYEDKSHLLS